MIIGNATSHAKTTMNILQNNKNNASTNPLIKSNKVDKPSMFGKTSISSDKQTNDTVNERMKQLMDKLSSAEDSEREVQNGMYLLHEKQTCLDTIKGAGERLQDLSKQYKDSNLTADDKAKIEKEADKILKGLDHLMNGNNSGNNSILDSKVIPLKDSEGNAHNIMTNSFSITLEAGKLDDIKLNDPDEKSVISNAHFKIKISTQSLLQHPSLIDDQMLKPVEKALDDVNDAKSKIYTTFLDDFASTTSSIEELNKLGKISDSMTRVKMELQKSLYSTISALRFQSSNINKDNVSELLK